MYQERNAIQLFRASSFVPNFRGYRDVVIDWFVNKRETPLVLPYASLIENYDDGQDCYSKHALDEMFTEAEVAALAGYLKDQYGDNPKIEKVSLPIPSNIMGPGATPVGGPQDFLMISKRFGYPLPFEVWGLFDLRHAEREPEPQSYMGSAPGFGGDFPVIFADGRVVDDSLF